MKSPSWLHLILLPGGREGFWKEAKRKKEARGFKVPILSFDGCFDSEGGLLGKKTHNLFFPF